MSNNLAATSIRAPEANAKSQIEAETLRVKRQSIADWVAEYDRAEMAAALQVPAPGSNHQAARVS